MKPLFVIALLCFLMFLACPGNLNLVTRPSVCDASAVFGAVIATDNCPGASFSQTSGLSNSSLFPRGSSSVGYTATDAAGLSQSCSFTVNIVDSELPSIQCPSSVVMDNDANVCGAAVSYSLPSGSDNCPSSTISLTQGFNSGSVFPVGTTRVRFTIEDTTLQSSTCEFNVTIRDSQPPSIGLFLFFVFS